MKILFALGALFLILGTLILNTPIIPCSSAECHQFFEKLIFLFLFPGAFLFSLSGLILRLFRPEWSISFAIYLLVAVLLVLYSGFGVSTILVELY